MSSSAESLGPATAAAVAGSCAAAAAGQIAEVVLAGLQLLLQQPQEASHSSPQQQQPQQAQQAQQTHRTDFVVDADVLDQVLAVIAALLEVTQAPQSTTVAGTVTQAVAASLELLLFAPGVDSAHQLTAVQLLSRLLQQQLQHGPGQRGRSEQAGADSTAVTGTAAVQQVVLVLCTAGASASADVRAAATEAAGACAQAALQCVQQGAEHADLAAAQGTLLQLLQLLASRGDDVDAAVAAEAQASTAQLALPLYLVSICSSNGSMEASAADNMHNLDALNQGAAAGFGSKWKRLAALQPQQRAFKGAQLAQLFDVSFHASPAMLQRYSQRAGQQRPQQPPQAKHAAQAAALYRLAQTLPLLPGAGGSSGSSSVGIRLHFEELSSAAVIGWLLTQEAARQCVSARMRTHLGNPTQSFGALERVMQVFLQQLQGDESPQAHQQAWQRQLLQLMQTAVPQQQLQQQGQQQGSGQQAEPQQLLQAPGAAAGAAAAHAGASHRRPHPHHQHQHPSRAAAAAAADGADGSAAAAAVAEELRIESEAAVGSLLDFMYALEVNIQAATEGSMMRPAVSKSVMAFFAGNKKVLCEDWLSVLQHALSPQSRHAAQTHFWVCSVLGHDCSTSTLSSG